LRLKAYSIKGSNNKYVNMRISTSNRYARYKYASESRNNSNIVECTNTAIRAKLIMVPGMNLLPFSSMYFTPVQIYLGQLTAKEIGTKFLIQMLWIGVLYLCGNIFWKKGKKKLVVQGG
ncbi:MAG: ABC-2 family transporter protein, partial [Lachnospiraceae bacterium]|nr:ABC-2 family transporter protein [Lachnospiraceae bacterium]